ncbi:MAG: Bro-N domain-containing protein [Bacteroidota bacterium]|nr:Bro-N domain-containing protein [Bacteroidota bacterium]
MELVHKQFGVVRAETKQDGSIWFVAKDVCDALGYTNVDSAVRKLDDDEKLNRKIYASGQNREMTTINESGLYTLILRSNKPDAKKFRRWVTGDVLPALRKYGTYNMQKQLDLSEYLKEPKQALIWHNNILCVNVGWMLENEIMTKVNYSSMVRRGRIWRVRRGGNGRSALVVMQSLPYKYRKRVIELSDKQKEIAE